jgi:uncharacterized protein (DUF2141 family)
MKFRSRRTTRAVQLVVLLLAAQPALSEEFMGLLTVEIAGLKDATGDVYIAVYDSDSNWLSDETVLEKKVVIADTLDGEMVRTELQLPLGDYALSAFYDKDGDGELDTNFIGIPREPIALSNNAVAQFGAPDYADAVFSLGAEPLIQRILMRDM